jgi:hypothetical protein
MKREEKILVWKEWKVKEVDIFPQGDMNHFPANPMPIPPLCENLERFK